VKLHQLLSENELPPISPTAKRILTSMDASSPDNGPPSGGWFEVFGRLWEFKESIELVLSVLAGLILAVLLCLMPFTELGAEEPWYFWIGSGLVALAASVLLGWVFFPPSSRGKKKSGGVKREEIALTEIERLLLMAAAIHGLGPKTNLSVANADRVVGQVLEWAGLMDAEVREAWENPGMEYRPAIIRVYGALIRMTHQMHRGGSGRPPAKPGEVLFEGGGNFGTADDPQAFPHFTSCRLTARGEQLARQLLEQYPDYGKSV
jgi:hypothetical protein